MDLLAFAPIYQDRVWGGQGLTTALGRTLPHDGPIGESWEIVDRPEAQSRHQASGLTLAELMTRYAFELMGPDWSDQASRPFPILVKWLDCQDRLSLQVHPPQHVAPQLGGEPKTECWFIAQAQPQAALYVGLKHGTERTAFESILQSSGGGELEPLIHKIPVQAGESILLESGRIHAIDAGNLILEIQQNSDTTYRVYDWDRVGLDGKPRALHIKESLESIDFNDFEPSTVPAHHDPGERVIAKCDEFTIRQVNLVAGESFYLSPRVSPKILSVVSGRLNAVPETSLLACQNESLTAREKTLSAADNLIVPFAWGGQLHALEDTTALITDGFV